MTTTWAARLASTDGKNLRTFLTVEGVPDVFQTGQVDVPSTIISSARPRRKLVTQLSQGETRINADARKQEGGDLYIELVDDDDGSLLELFTPRRFRQSFLATSIDSDDEVLVLPDTSALDETGVIYIDAETMDYEVTDPTEIEVTRGAYGSEAVPHFGVTDNGAGIFTSPPFWVSRRVTLTGYWQNDDGSSTSALSVTLGVFSIEKPPQHMGGRRWCIRCCELSDEFGSKKIGGGLFEVQLPPDARMFLQDGNGRLKVGAGANYAQFVLGAAATHVLIRGDDIDGNPTAACHRLLGQIDDSNDDTIELDMVRLVTGSAFMHVPKTARHVAILTGRASTVALRLITSRLGDETNGGKDELPGLDQAALGDPQWRMGAGIDEDEVDVTAFTGMGFGSPWSYVLDDEADLADFLFELCLHLNAMWFVNRSGQLSIVSMRADASDAVMTIAESMIDPEHPPQVSYAEDSIYPRARVECNYDPITKKFWFVHNWHDVDLQRRYPHREESFEIASKSIVVTDQHQRTGGLEGTIARQEITTSELEHRFRSLMVSDGRGRAHVKLRLDMRILAAEVGQVVNLTADIPDLEGNASVSSQVCRIIAMRPNYEESCVDVELQLLDKLFRIAPACVVASAAAEVMTLRTTGPEINADPNPGRFFAVGAKVRLVDVSAATFETFDVDAQTDGTVTLSGTPGFTVENNVDFLTLDEQPQNDGVNANQNAFTPMDYLYQMPDNENDADVVLVTRYR